MHKKMDRPTVIAGKVMWNAAVSANCHRERSRTDEGIDRPLSEGTASLSRLPRHGITTSVRRAPKLAIVPHCRQQVAGLTASRNVPAVPRLWNGSVLRPA